jgi:CreA protein
MSLRTKRFFVTFFTKKVILSSCLLFAAPAFAQQKIGDVPTNFRWLGPDDQVVIERFDDQRVPVSCYASFAQTGGISGGLGLAEDPSVFALSCVAHGPVSIPADMPQKEAIGAISASLLFKHFTLTRFSDANGHALIYVLISTKVLHGSPANAVSAVPAS